MKAFVGDHGGLICTSSNAKKAFTWGFERGKRIFFFPDENLGYNTAHDMGIPDEEIVVYNPTDLSSRHVLTDRARVVLWKGHCHVHTNFRPEHVVETREKYPDVKIVVHPECEYDVVSQADANGSTSFIVNYVDNQPSGSTIAIGTEINLINRLAKTYPDKKIFELSGQTCPVCANMYRTTLNDLVYCLENYKDVKSDKGIFSVTLIGEKPATCAPETCCCNPDKHQN